MYCNTSCTLYLFSKNYAKITVPKCFMTQRTLYATSKLGLSYTEEAFCMIQGYEELVFTKNKDFILLGDVTVEVDTTTQKGMSDTIHNLIQSGAHTIMMADWKGYGNKSMRHWELSCK